MVVEHSLYYNSIIGEKKTKIPVFFHFHLILGLQKEIGEHFGLELLLCCVAFVVLVLILWSVRSRLFHVGFFARVMIKSRQTLNVVSQCSFSQWSNRYKQQM